MTREFVDSLQSLSDEELKDLTVLCEKIRITRRNKVREKLITDFRKAWGALKDAGIDVRYLDEYEYEQDTYLRDWDCFCFD